MLTKKAKTFLGITLAGIMALGGITAFANGGTALIAAPEVKLTDISFKEGTATIVKGIIPKVIKSGITPTTTLTVAEGVKLEDISFKEGTATVVKGIIPQANDGKSFTTSARK